MEKELLAQLGKTSTDLGVAQTQLTTLTATNETLTTELASSTADVTRLTAELATANTAKDEAEVKLAAATADAPEGSAQELAAVKEFVDANFAAAVTASGKTDVVAEGLVARLNFISEEGINLHQIVSAGTDGKSKSKEDNSDLPAELAAILQTNRKGDK